MVLAAGDVLGGNPGEIAYVLGKYGETARYRCCEHGQIVLPRKAETAYRADLETGCFEVLRQGCGIHLVEKNFHRWSARAVSLR